MSVLKLLEKKQLAPEDAESSEEDSSQPEDSYESEGEEEEKEESAFKEPSQKQWKNRSRVLITAGRGHAPGFKTVVRDIIDLLPHSKKESKVNKKTAIADVLELCESLGCNSYVYFEPRKSTDMYMWIGKYPSGPSVKFQLKGVHCSTDLKMTGNCLKGSRPLLSFDRAFLPSEKDFLKNKHMVLLKELLSGVFNTPRYHPKSKPFVDHVFSFKYLEDCIWFRNFQIMNENDEKFTEMDQVDNMNLVEIGPRFGLVPIKILDGCFSGETVWQNGNYITPAKLRSRKYGRYTKKRAQKEKRWKTLEETRLEETPLDKLYEDDE